MGQKKLKFGTAAIIATGVVGFFGAEATGAFAQEGVLQTETLSLDTAQEPALVDETMPVMVSEPVVHFRHPPFRLFAEAEYSLDPPAFVVSRHFTCTSM